MAERRRRLAPTAASKKVTAQPANILNGRSRQETEVPGKDQAVQRRRARLITLAVDALVIWKSAQLAENNVKVALERLSKLIVAINKRIFLLNQEIYLDGTIPTRSQK